MDCAAKVPCFSRTPSLNFLLRISAFDLRVCFSLTPANQGNHDSLDLQFFLRNEIRITRVFGAQVGFAFLQDKGLEGDLAIDQSGNNVAGTWFNTMFDNGDIAINNAFANHGIAVDLEAEGPGGWFDPQGFYVNQNTAFLFLRRIHRPAGWDRAVDRYGYDLQVTWERRRPAGESRKRRADLPVRRDLRTSNYPISYTLFTLHTAAGKNARAPVHRLERTG